MVLKAIRFDGRRVRTDVRNQVLDVNNRTGFIWYFVIYHDTISMVGRQEFFDKLKTTKKKHTRPNEREILERLITRGFLLL